MSIKYGRSQTIALYSYFFVTSSNIIYLLPRYLTLRSVSLLNIELYVLWPHQRHLGHKAWNPELFQLNPVKTTICGHFVFIKMDSWRYRVNYVHEVNAYVNSRHPQPAFSVLFVEAAANPDHPIIHPEWKKALDQYREELDRLREDWALEVFSQPMRIPGSFRRTKKLDAMQKAVFGLPWYAPRNLFTKTYGAMVRVSSYWDIHLMKRIYDRPWLDPRRQLYLRRKKEIDRKYCRLLGM